MLIKNISARGWHVGGKFIAPGQEVDVEVKEAEVKDNADLVIVKPAVEKLKPGPKPKFESPVPADPVIE